MEQPKLWTQTWQPARLEEILGDGRVRCHLSPRNCIIKEGKNGFCGVRGNRGGRLVTMNFGKSVHITEETIETEACNHYAPGERILSLGNIGCMLNCSYCHNWKTSQAKYVEDHDVYHYTPEGVIEIAKRHGIRIISWTYNDPVVWHEFVLETSKLAKAAGITTLYKSAFFINEKAVEELLPVIDIFSISIKSIDPEYYRRYTTGRLQPVLDATRQVYLAGKHVEVSTLMITGISDNDKTARDVSDWVLKDLDASVPLHFVRFHPDYKMRDSIRTPIPNLLRARELSLDMGVEQVYLGNVYDTPFSNTYCRSCGQTLVERYGLNAVCVGIDAKANCTKCGEPSKIKLLPASTKQAETDNIPDDALLLPTHDWHGDIQSLHVQVRNTGNEQGYAFVRRRMVDGSKTPWKITPLALEESYRFIVARCSPDDLGPEIAVSPNVVTHHSEVFDRAHFPTLSIEQIGEAVTDVTPLPRFQGNQMS